MPVTHQEKTIGIFLVANKTTDYNDKDKNLLETIVGSVAPILHAKLQHDNHERKRKKAEDSLRVEQQRLFSLLERLDCRLL